MPIKPYSGDNVNQSLDYGGRKTLTGHEQINTHLEGEPQNEEGFETMELSKDTDGWVFRRSARE